MADDWIKMRVNLPTDPAVLAISGRLDMSTAEVVGYLHRVWSWVDQQSRTCNVGGVTSVTLDRIIGAPNFAQAMVEVGWLTVDDVGITFPNYEGHISKSAKNRALASKRVQRFRNAPIKENRYQRKSKSKSTIPPLTPPSGEGSKVYAALISEFHPEAIGPKDEKSLRKELPDFEKLCGENPDQIAKRAKEWRNRGNAKHLTPSLLRRNWSNLRTDDKLNLGKQPPEDFPSFLDQLRQKWTRENPYAATASDASVWLRWLDVQTYSVTHDTRTKNALPDTEPCTHCSGLAEKHPDLFKPCNRMRLACEATRLRECEAERWVVLCRESGLDPPPFLLNRKDKP